MKILVTGADGFIGSHLTEELVKRGYEVKAFAYYNSFNNWGWLDTLPKEVMNHVEIFQGDIRDPNGVREAMKGIDEVYHLAALIAIPFTTTHLLFLNAIRLLFIRVWILVLSLLHSLLLMHR